MGLAKSELIKKVCYPWKLSNHFSYLKVLNGLPMYVVSECMLIVLHSMTTNLSVDFISWLIISQKYILNNTLTVIITHSDYL